MPNLANQLDLDRCPHCGVDRPNLVSQHHVESSNHAGENKRWWRFYRCGRCGFFVAAAGPSLNNGPATEIFPAPVTIDSALPERARDYLEQALNSLHAPAGAVMLAASAVDAMLKAKDYKKGSLYDRIDKAAEDRMITPDMAKWAHEVRLDANDQRHADESAVPATRKDAQRCVDFARALGDVIFVLPARVKRGLSEAAGGN